MKLLTVALALVCVTACAPVTEAQRDAREYSRVEFRNQFIEDRRRCFASGGRIYIQARGGSVDRDGIPKTRVPYVCGQIQS